MYQERFSSWHLWQERDQLEELGLPGVYAVARSNSSLVGTPFRWDDEIIYIGMTNSVRGLRARLKQFDNSMQGKLGHGGAQRVKYKHREYSTFCENAYVAVAAFACDPRSNQPSDLRTMGDVARFEYLCFAEFVEKFGRLPEFNDKERSPKSRPAK